MATRRPNALGRPLRQLAPADRAPLGKRLTGMDDKPELGRRVGPFRAADRAPDVRPRDRLGVAVEIDEPIWEPEAAVTDLPRPVDQDLLGLLPRLGAGVE